MKFFKQYKMDHGGVLYDNGDYDTSDPVAQKLEASKRMQGIGRIFAAYTKPEEQVLEQLTKQQNGKKINN